MNFRFLKLTPTQFERPSNKRDLVKGLLFITPAIIGFLAFALYPFLQSLYYSFTDYNILEPARWVGWENYTHLLKDDLFWQSLYNTFFMVVIGLPIHLIFNLLIALLLNTKIKGQSVFRAIFYLPSITPIVASVVVWMWIFNSQYGLLNSILAALHIPAVGWLTDPAWTKPSLIIMGLWYGGNTILIYLAALQDVPRELLESAELDGANTWQKTWSVTLPMISPVIFYTLVLNLIGYFQIFTEGWVLTSTREGGAGGPGNSLMFLVMYLYQNAFHFSKMGYASAMAWVLLLIILLITILLFLTSGWVFYRSAD
jgi:multiple sugar transport system permease protein